MVGYDSLVCAGFSCFGPDAMLSKRQTAAAGSGHQQRLLRRTLLAGTSGNAAGTWVEMTQVKSTRHLGKEMLPHLALPQADQIIRPAPMLPGHLSLALNLVQTPQGPATRLVSAVRFSQGSERPRSTKLFQRGSGNPPGMLTEPCTGGPNPGKGYLIPWEIKEEKDNS